MCHLTVYIKVSSQHWLLIVKSGGDSKVTCGFLASWEGPYTVNPYLIPGSSVSGEEKTQNRQHNIERKEQSWRTDIT